MKILFMGTPDFAVPSLEALIQAGHDVCGVFTQPDKPKNRKMKLMPPPVKEIAIAHNIPVYQPGSLRNGDAMEYVRALEPELIVVTAYGRILPEKILSCPRYGCINVHASLLPKLRGAAPINWAVINGETETGITMMYMARELDAGDIIAQKKTPIGPDETAEQLYQRLARMGGELLVQTVEDISGGTARRIVQDESQATFAPMLTRALSPIDWSQSAQAIHDKIRGLLPWPAASTDAISGAAVKIFESVCAGETTSAAPGTVLCAKAEGIDMACGDGKVLRITALQAPGGRRMRVADYLRGHSVLG